jgi:hypothetical protein
MQRQGILSFFLLSISLFIIPLLLSFFTLLSFFFFFAYFASHLILQSGGLSARQARVPSPHQQLTGVRY